MSHDSETPTGISTHLIDDGARVIVRFERAAGAPVAFTIDYEQASAVILHLISATRAMVRGMVSTGVADKYLQPERRIDPLHAMTYQVGHDVDTREAILSIQTEEGPLVDVAFPPGALSGLRSGDDGGSGGQVH